MPAGPVTMLSVCASLPGGPCSMGSSLAACLQGLRVECDVVLVLDVDSAREKAYVSQRDWKEAQS